MESELWFTGDFVSEWESIFGAGVSAESVIAGINASWDDEERDAQREKDLERRASVTAFRDDPDTKAALLRTLASRAAVGVMDGDVDILECLAFSPEDSHKAIEAAYNIPEELVRLIGAVFTGLQLEPKMVPGAIDWLFECMTAIEPGVDLRFVASKFAADIAGSSLCMIGNFSMLKGADVQDACAPALAVAYARARGVIVQNELAVDAAKAAWDAVSAGDWENNRRFGYLTVGDFMAAIVSSAADPKPEGPALAASYAAQACLRVGGDATDWATWREFSDELVLLIKEAPREPLWVVDLDQVVLQLSGACPQTSQT